MKKNIILSAIILSCGAALANQGFTPTMINDIQTFQGTSIHDLNSIKLQRFRYEEINEAKDIQQQKEEKNREQADIVKDPAMKKIFNRKPNQEVKFVEENGEIKIEGVEFDTPKQ